MRNGVAVVDSQIMVGNVGRGRAAGDERGHDRIVWVGGSSHGSRGHARLGERVPDGEDRQSALGRERYALGWVWPCQVSCGMVRVQSWYRKSAFVTDRR